MSGGGPLGSEGDAEGGSAGLAFPRETVDVVIRDPLRSVWGMTGTGSAEGSAVDGVPEAVAWSKPPLRRVEPRDLLLERRQREPGSSVQTPPEEDNKDFIRHDDGHHDVKCTEVHSHSFTGKHPTLLSR